MIRTVSAMVSPFATEVTPMSATLSTSPPSLSMAASNESRVRVLGS